MGSHHEWCVVSRLFSPSSEDLTLVDVTGPREHEYLKELRKEALGDALTIGELPNTPKLKDVLAYISRDSKELDTV